MIALKVQRTSLVLVLGLACCGSPKSDPWKLSTEHLASWTSDCPVTVTETRTGHDKKDPDTVTVGDRVAFASAARRLRCEPSGWSLWLDANDRIAGVCTESYVDITVTPSQIATSAERGEPILRRHFPKSVVVEMVAGFCLEWPRTIGDDLLRWEMRLARPTKHSRFACCWEVTK